MIRRFSPAAVAKRKKELKERNEGENEPESMIIQPTKLPSGEEDVTVDHLAVYDEDSDLEEEGEVPFEKGPDAFYDDISQSTAPMHVLPLYSLLDEKKQLRIWDPVPEGERLVVVATNVAETSITIPNIKYVVDCGRAKEKVWEKETGICEYKVQWISQASAEQRQGRAGRVAPGHCYRLYSAAVFQQQFPVWDTPEVCRTPLEDTVLLMKDMGIKNVEAFPFPTQPDAASLHAAVEVLRALGAVDGAKDEITVMGKEMMKYPVGVRYAKMLVLARERENVLPLVVGIIAALTGRTPIIRPEELLMRENRKENGNENGNENQNDNQKDNQKENQKEGDDNQDENEANNGNENDEKKEDENGEDEMEVENETTDATEENEELKKCRESLLLWRDASSDALSSLRLLGAFLHTNTPSLFCKEHFLREKSMREMVDLRKQINRLLISQQPSLSAALSKPLLPPTSKQASILRQIIAAGFIDHVARRMTPSEARDIDIPRGKVPYLTTTLNELTPAFIHRESFVNPIKLSDYVRPGSLLDG